MNKYELTELVETLRADADDAAGCEHEYEHLDRAADALEKLFAENEEMAERMRLWSFMHGKKAEDLIDRNIYLQAEVRRLKIAAGEPVEPLPEEFVGPHRLSIGDRLRRKLLAKGDQDNG